MPSIKREIQLSREDSQQEETSKDLTEVKHTVPLDKAGHVKITDP